MSNHNNFKNLRDLFQQKYGVNNFDMTGAFPSSDRKNSIKQTPQVRQERGSSKSKPSSRQQSKVKMDYASPVNQKSQKDLMTDRPRQSSFHSPLSQYQSFFQFQQLKAQLEHIKQQRLGKPTKPSKSPSQVKVVQVNFQQVQPPFSIYQLKGKSMSNSQTRNSSVQAQLDTNKDIKAIAPPPEMNKDVRSEINHSRYQSSQLELKSPQIMPKAHEVDLIEQLIRSQRDQHKRQKIRFKNELKVADNMFSMKDPSSCEDDEVRIVDNYRGVLKANFIFHYVIGKGGFGKVWKVELKKNRVAYAMKEMSKAKIISKRSVNSVMNERHLLSELNHSFLVNMSYAFQDRDNLYLIMDLLTGGDLRYHVGKMRRFKEHQTKFFVGCILLALEYLHVNNIIHRDLKPENLVLDDKGYVRLTDLGIARVWKAENSADTSGTPGYMAPEVMCHQNHGIAVDYFALGVITYEFMLGRRPYQGRSRKEIREQIMAKQVQIRKHEIPDDWSLDAADFVNRLIQRKPPMRLGFNGPEEVKNHPWLKNFPWQKLQNKEIEAAYIPQTIDDNYDYLNQISEDNDSQDELIQQNVVLLRKNSVQNLFAGYSYESTMRGSQQMLKKGSTKSTQSSYGGNGQYSEYRYQ